MHSMYCWVKGKNVCVVTVKVNSRSTAQSMAKALKNSTVKS